MDRRGDQRPPRSARPGRPQQSHSRSPAPSYPEQSYPARQSTHPQYQQPQQPQHNDQSRVGVSFQNTERGDRRNTVDTSRPPRSMPSAYQNQISPNVDMEHGDYNDPSRVGRKKSLVRPDREKIEPGHRQWHYRSRVAQLEEEGHGRGVMASSTGNAPQTGLRRGKSLLAREEDVHESGLHLFKLRKRTSASATHAQQPSNQSEPKKKEESPKKRLCWKDVPGPVDAWMMYCLIITIFIPGFFLKSFGIRSPEAQRAWREKMGLVFVILTLMAGVGFLTFGFTEAVCGKPPERFHGGAIGPDHIGNSSVVIHGYDYDFSDFRHPSAGMFDGTTNPVLQGGWNLGGNDASFMFQKVNQNCLGLIRRASGSSITGSGEMLDWYFPCNIFSQYGNSGVNFTNYESSTSCHTSSQARGMLDSMKPQGQVYYTWDDVQNSGRNLAVYESTVLDLSLLNWLSRAQVTYPDIFDRMKNADGTFDKKDLTMYFSRTSQQQIGHCLQDIVSIGFIDTNSIGCVASEVVLYLSLVFIIGVVAIRFVMAVMFQWFFSWKLGNFPRETYEQRMQRSAEIENWTNDIYRPAPSEYRPNVGKNGNNVGYKWKPKKKTFLPSTSRFTPSENNMLKGVGQRPSTAYGMLDSSPSGYKRSTVYAGSAKGGGSSKGTPPDTPYRQSRSTMSFGDSVCPFPLNNVVPQPGPEWEPFNFPLAHTICLVTAYSESVEGLRTTLDSLATTDYPNSHKLILVIADGMVKGAGNDLTTPEIVLSMMKEFVIAPNDVEPHSYVAIADGHKRHNMAKVYAGFYEYDDATVERSKQQRVPMVLVAKTGNPLEQGEAKPGNRGKRDSQIVLMAFLQKVIFDERMTTFEYEFFNSIWRVTGISPDRYELVLCVDADTKVFPDSLTRMVSCMVHDEEIMGLCGETKIANKAETFITMMQVFEYYISHHMTKAFESMFGGVTCLPGCFSMYRIKARKGDSNYWVPILANPDIVEHYSENVVDTLHKKNLLLLGEDRYLTTLMLKTFPKRKNVFCPQAVCKTIVPDTFKVLLSQRRRWINSTIHNLAELLLVRDLCGTFCFSMQFVVGMELAGTLVLPAAIAFTLYLIIVSIIPGGTDTTIPLILLGIVLGLPGLLIVVTSRKVAYIGWMLVYLLSLPIWNGILPAYAFWHFDDFSWGQTRKIAGDQGDGHGDKDGEFDSSNIVMKRWAEFERDRRWKNGTQSRDSAYYDKKTEYRYSTASNSDLTHPYTSNGADSSTVDSATTPASRSRYDSNAVLMLPAPLAVNRPPMSSSTSVVRTSEDAYGSDNSSNRRLVPSPSGDQYGSPGLASTETAYDSSGRLLSPNSQQGYPRAKSGYSSSSPDVQNPFRSNSASPAVAGYEEVSPFSPEPEEIASPTPMSPPPGGNGYRPVSMSSNGAGIGAGGGRGVRLTDSGPVPGPEGVRRVRQNSRRPTSQIQGYSGPSSPPPQSTSPYQQQQQQYYAAQQYQQQSQQQGQVYQQNRYSRSSSAYQLPPGAAPPNPGGDGGRYLA
ncbi:hypothetical protein AX16_000701 [Volvariella volvacea WC 439]|nr:hypothetical protein AX16_000701 [Volvariella volvacea WC 439]